MLGVVVAKRFVPISASNGSAYGSAFRDAARVRMISDAIKQLAAPSN
jgi:hypothetical protein